MESELSMVNTDGNAFYAKCKIENVADRAKSVVLPRMLVDTGSEYTWVPAKSLEKIGIDREKKDVLFVMANGQHVTRVLSFAGWLQIWLPIIFSGLVIMLGAPSHYTEFGRVRKGQRLRLSIRSREARLRHYRPGRCSLAHLLAPFPRALV